MTSAPVAESKGREHSELSWVYIIAERTGCCPEEISGHDRAESGNERREIETRVLSHDGLALYLAVSLAI